MSWERALLAAGEQVVRVEAFGGGGDGGVRALVRVHTEHHHRLRASSSLTPGQARR